jgi:hypothetical protein
LVQTGAITPNGDHAGSTVVAQTDCAQATNLANQAILRLLVDPSLYSLKSVKELEDWFDKQALGV